MATFQIQHAKNFKERLKGLMFSDNLPMQKGFLISHCTSVHTCFMRYPIDLVYLNTQGQITRLVPCVKAWRMSWGGAHAAHILELVSGSIKHYQLTVGMQLSPWKTPIQDFTAQFTSISHE